MLSAPTECLTMGQTPLKKGQTGREPHSVLLHVKQTSCCSCFQRETEAVVWGYSCVLKEKR